MVRIARTKSGSTAARVSPYTLLSFAICAQVCFMLAVYSGGPPLGLLQTGLAGFGASRLVGSGGSGRGQLRGMRYRTRHLVGEKEAEEEEEGAMTAAASAPETADAEKKTEPLPQGWEEVWPLPEGWESFGFGRIRKHFKCKAYARDITKPLPTDEDWNMFKKRYREAVDAEAKFDDPVPGTLGYTFGDGGPPPFHARHGERGRGLFASRDIKKGELVHDGERSEVMFPSGHSWRKYVFSLPRTKACDVIDWTWTQTHESDGKMHAFSAMNIAVLENGGSEETINVGPDTPSSLKMYALRDIAAGEEILEEYDEVTDWKKVGL